MNRIATLGITGGIGSGKSYVCNLFSRKGIRIYDADSRAKWLLENNPSIIQQVTNLLGKEAYHDNHKPNRTWIAEQVFSNPDKLSQLNAIIHPATIADFNEWRMAVPDHYPWHFQLKEAAILFESGTDKGLDAIITVSAPEEIRIERVMKRDGIPKEKVLERISRQLSEEERIKRSDYVLRNDQNADIQDQVEKLIQQLESRFGL